MGDEGMANQPGEKTLLQGHGAIFRDGQAAGVDVAARIAPVEIVPGGVVAGMLTAPIGVRRQRQDAA